MHYEVEQKYRVNDHAETGLLLVELGATSVETVKQVDAYYAHPNRDFAVTDEALRIRQVEDKNFLTYKGPKLDTTTKTRREFELGISQGEHGALLAKQLLEALSFRLVAKVSKVRQLFQLGRDGRKIELALDEVEGLGPFVELEIAVDDEAGIKSAQRTIAAMATELKLLNVERCSYLELLLGQK